MLLQAVCSFLLIATIGVGGIYRLNEPCEDISDWKNASRNLYVLIEEGVTWFEAKEGCESMNGTLAIPATCQEKNRLRALLANATSNDRLKVTNELHAGFFRPDFFITEFGTPLFSVGYQKWLHNQSNPQICGTYNHNLLLYDAKCMDKRSFVCEFPPRSDVKQVNITSAPLLVQNTTEGKSYQPNLKARNFPSSYWAPLMQQGRMHWYRIETYKARWSAARESCESSGGHLLILDHQAEANAIQSYVLNKQNLTNSLYVGFHNGNNFFITLFGRPVKNGWEREQPDDETCLAVTHDMLLHKVPCWQGLNFICEMFLT